MSAILWIVVLGLAFAACRWSGRLFDGHYADKTELFAVALVALSVLGPLMLGAASARLWGLPTGMLLFLAVGGGLLLGRRREVSGPTVRRSATA
ncbi:hypothetical protein J421_6169 (plasmid) [Gemmatirosa kalamazoonensis]|jgi:hypothetical protein|uniref:Uncharacterized protein n=1 Tax=Gemmatirosa kalamazoonensis TaxID=861299 RepID=W0RRW2_9BACT|nr:hypothetical protein [Gemmatirosa kalamazoonensis]AHG93704.1 hypothetical protein J421_6169 [Gemmatirosa kalamazoonensis]